MAKSVDHIIEVEKAEMEDINSLVEMRLYYLAEDNGYIDENDAGKIREALPDYYRKHLKIDRRILMTSVVS